ncbi:MAG TPA: hypothetical protein VNZ66_08145 [Aeromicrobium sp.]|nr:hypothetical protein [Aeromicrobium sp.]
MDLDTWVSIGSLAVAFTGLAGLVVGQNRATRNEAQAHHETALAAIERVRTEARTDHLAAMEAIERARTEAREANELARTEAREANELARTEARHDHRALARQLSVLEERTYDMATRLLPSATERPTG